MGIERWYPQGQTQPLVSAAVWDVLTVNGAFLPGRAKVTRAAAGWKQDAKKKPGADADRPTILGFDPRPIGFEILCATTDQVDEVNRVLGPYYPAPGGTKDPIRIGHASIDHLTGIKNMQILEVSAWELQSDRRLKLSVSGTVWVGSPKRPKDGKVVKTPTKAAPPNKRRDDAEKRGTAGGSNPAPSTQSNYCAPNFTPGA